MPTILCRYGDNVQRFRVVSWNDVLFALQVFNPHTQKYETSGEKTANLGRLIKLFREMVRERTAAYI